MDSTVTRVNEVKSGGVYIDRVPLTTRRTIIPADKANPICCDVRALVSKNAGQNGDDAPNAAYIET